MVCPTKASKEYKSLIGKLPKVYQNSYNKLLQYGAYMIIGLHFAKRANKGMDKLTNMHFQKFFDEDLGYHYRQVKAQKTKNWQKNAQNMKLSGIIPYGEKNKFGLDPGLYIESYLSRLDPSNPNFFQASRKGKQFKKSIHRNQNQNLLLLF